MQIAEGIHIIDLALYLPKQQAVIFSDFHLGYEEMLTSRGTLIPHFQLRDTITRLGNIFKKIETSEFSTRAYTGGNSDSFRNGKFLTVLKNPSDFRHAQEPHDTRLVGIPCHPCISRVVLDTPVNKIIINGDLKHEFGTISAQEWREILQLIDYFSKRCKEIVIIKGNHDIKLTPIMKKRGIAITKNYRLGDILIAHGDSIDKESDDKKIKTIIIGHVHPAITIRSATRSEKFKCFVKGKYKRKTLVIQPSFNVLIEGTDIREGTNSPYASSMHNAEIFVVGENILHFGKVKNIG